MVVTAQDLGYLRPAAPRRSTGTPTLPSVPTTRTRGSVPSRPAGDYGVPSHRSTTDPTAPGYNPSTSWIHPAYTGNDPAWLAWQAQAEAQAQDAISQAKLRRSQLNDAYRAALEDADRQSVFGRRNIQTGMLQRGMFRSGETDRRQSEFDAQVAQAKANSNRALQDQLGQVDVNQSNFMSNLSSQAAQQVSQAMMRDALAQYQAQQQAAATPTAVAAPAFSAPPPPQQQAAAKPAANKPPPVYNSAGLYQAQAASAPKPKPKPASGSTGHLTQSRKPGQLQ